MAGVALVFLFVLAALAYLWIEGILTLGIIAVIVVIVFIAGLIMVFNN